MKYDPAAWASRQATPAAGRMVFLDGQFVPAGEAKVSVFDRGFLYGDGVFEGIRAYNGRVFRLKEHVARLYDSARAIRLQVPISEAEMNEVVVETVKLNNLWDAYIRLIVSRGPGHDLGLDPRACPMATIVCIADAIKLFPAELYEKGLKLATAATRRNIPEALNPRIKSLNYLNNILAKLEANEAGVLEALMLNQDGFVSEGTGDNVFIVKGGRLLTPAVHQGALHGITRACIIDLAGRRGIEATETILARLDVFLADECFLTGTAAEVIPVVELDGRPIGSGAPGPVTRRLIADFRALVQLEGTAVYTDEERAALKPGAPGPGGDT